MVKLPNLELKEVERIVEALDYYCSALSAAKSEDTPEYAQLVEMLKRRAGLKGQPPCAMISKPGLNDLSESIRPRFA
jgi:hypothetical protein